MNKRILLFALLIFVWACSSKKTDQPSQPETPYLMIVGIAQDGGYPQAGCNKKCCKTTLLKPDAKRNVTSLALIHPSLSKYWLFEATPDFRDQLLKVGQIRKTSLELPTGIFITHAHIGHYTGLMHLGREVIGAKNVNVYALPRLTAFLKENGPWSQLVELKNINAVELQANTSVSLSPKINVTPIPVPHRDEFSETAGFSISGPTKKALFVPDIDKWERWDHDIRLLVPKYDYVLIDATFYDAKELPGRDMSKIPHPFVEESIALLKELTAENRKKVYFIHFNHTNPLIHDGTEAKKVRAAGFNLAREGLQLPL